MYTWYKTYFLHDWSPDSISCSEQKKGIWWKQYQNETATKHRRDNITMSDAIERTFNTPFSLPIHQARCQAASASAVVSKPLDALFILCWRIRCCYYSCLCFLPSLPTTLLSLYIPWSYCQSPAPSVVVFDPSDALSIPRPLPTSLLLSLSPQACFPGPVNIPTPLLP